MLEARQGHKMSNRTFWLITFGIAITGAVIFVAGFLFSYLVADFTMSDAQAKAYCSPKTPIVIDVQGAAEDDIFFSEEAEGLVDIY